MSDTGEEKVILARAKRGELPAFEELVTRYEKRVYTLALRSSGSTEDAADITQDTFLRAWRGIDGFRGDSGFSTWLFRIAMNLCVDLARRKTAGPQQRSLTGEDDAERPLIDPAPTPEERLENSEIGRELSEAIGLLTEEHRQIILLRDVSGLSYTEIAEALDLSEGTVKSRLSRARLSLRELLISRGNISLPSASKKKKGGGQG